MDSVRKRVMETMLDRTHIRKLLIISIRKCYRSICNHQFLVCMLCSLLLLYISFPLAFSILVSASPVLVCTAVLLGTLLSFGQPNIPDIETEEQVSHDVSSFQTEFPEGSSFFAEREENFALKRYTEERGFEEANLGEDNVDKVEAEHFPLSYVPLQLDDKHSREIGPENPVKEIAERGFAMWEVENRKVVDEENPTNGDVLSDGEAIENDYVFVQKVSDESGETKSEYSPQVSVDASQGEPLEISPGSWKHGKNDYEEENEDDSFDSGSDRAESSSPDASMDDILPVLDELHPLLDSDAPKPAETSHDVSYAASEHSHGTSDSSGESDEDTESQEETKGVKEDGVDMEEEKRPERKDSDSKSAIKWTEDDQKNLMDLGSSELERNQRLEHLIARRVARKTLRLLNQKNLIDLDRSDLPFNVPPISTMRRNPFDFPDASYGDMGLPPIPGSAPSIMQPRRNPFDIPYDPNEEKPDLKGDSFQQEYMNINQKEPFFKRYESFSVGPSAFGGHGQEKQDIKWKPVFVPELFSLEGTSYPSFQRQSSEMSDSKMSSVPDTESVSSAEQGEQNQNDPDFSPESEMKSNIDLASDQLQHTSQSSEDSDVDVQHLVERNIRLNEVEITLGSVDNRSELDLSSETEEGITPLELSPVETHLMPGPANDESSSRSSQSSKSEVLGNLPDDRKDIGSSELGDHHLQDSKISMEPSVGGSEFRLFTGEIENNQNIDHVCDRSPQAIDKFLSFSSVSSDTLAEIAEKGQPAALGIVSVGDTESEKRDDNIQGDKIRSSGNDEQFSSQIHGDNNPHISSGSSHHGLFEETSFSGSRNNLSHSDEPVASQSFDGFNKSQDLSSTFQEKSQARDQNAQVYEVMHKPASHLSLTYDSGTTLVGSPEFRAPTGEFDSTGDFGSEDHHEFQVAEDSIDEIKGIDEQILSELDTAGDFSVQGVETSSESESKLDEANTKSIESGEAPENLSSTECKLALPVLEARSLEDVDLALKQLQEGIDVNEVILPSSINDQLVLEEIRDGLKNESDFHVVEARSIGNINVALKQVSEGKICDQPKHDSNNDSDGLAAKEGGSSKLIESSGGGSVVEMNRTAVDKNEELSKEEGSSKLIESSVGSGVEMNRTPVDKTHEISEKTTANIDLDSSNTIRSVESDSKPSAEEINTSGIGSGLMPENMRTAECELDLPVLEARSHEDINMAFRQLHEGLDVKDVILPSSINDCLVSEETEDDLKNKSDFHVVEATSINDITVALQQISERKMDEQPKHDSKSDSDGAEAKEGESSKLLESSGTESGVEMNRTPADKSEETSEDTSVNIDSSRPVSSSAPSSSSF